MRDQQSRFTSGERCAEQSSAWMTRHRRSSPASGKWRSRKFNTSAVRCEVRSFLGRGDGEPLAVPFVADIFAQAELHPHVVVFEEQLAIRKLACLNPRFVRESREVRRPPFSCVRVAFDQWHVAARYRERD